jgi:hypothetical protein
MNVNIKNFIKDYTKSLNIKGCMGITFTMKQEGNKGKLNGISASQNFRHFMNVLNRKAYKQQFKRFNKRINVLPVIENSYTNRIHFHTILSIPENMKPNDYIQLIKEAWIKTDYGYREVDVKPYINSGWTEYITKFKSSNDDVDWENFYWNSRV